MSRPTRYRRHYADQVEKLCILGATDRDLAHFFDVCEATINNWKNKYPKFLEAIKRGKEEADMKVAQKLHERATGYSWLECQPIKIKEVYYNDQGKRCEKEHIEMVKVEKHTPPDATSMIFWLKNRKSDKWRDKQDINHSGGIQFIPIDEDDEEL